MATITPTTASSTTTAAATTDGARADRSALRKATLVTAAVATLATTALAAALRAAGVSFEIDGQAIPALGFAQMTFLWTVVGGVLAGSIRKRSTHPQRRFVQTTVALTVLSCIPSVTAPASNGTRLALVATHLVAAAIAIPLLARRLDA